METYHVLVVEDDKEIQRTCRIVGKCRVIFQSQTVIPGKEQGLTVYEFITQFDEERNILVIGINGKHDLFAYRIDLLDGKCRYHGQERKKKAQKIHYPITIGSLDNRSITFVRILHLDIYPLITLW